MSTPEEERERTPREEALVQGITLAAMLTAAVLAPLVERWMSDPDIGYLIRWHAKRIRHLIDRQLHELNIGIETAVGLWKIQEHLRAQWKVAK